MAHTTSEEDYSFLSIDEHILDKEWVRQPALYFKWAQKLADARKRLDDSKVALTLVAAELSQAIRENPDQYGIAKITEAAVTTAIPAQEEHQSAVRRINKAKHTVDVLDAVVTALEHRKRALEKLVDLYGQSYFSTPHTSQENQEAAAHAMKHEVRRRKRRTEVDAE